MKMNRTFPDFNKTGHSSQIWCCILHKGDIRSSQFGWMDERVIRHFCLGKWTGRDRDNETNGTCGQDETAV